MAQYIGKVSSNIEGFEESGTREIERSSIVEFEGIGTKEPKSIKFLFINNSNTIYNYII
ncbi:hypothetical protein RhiirA5_438531 [Rhizophagus irregularis]|uniref:Uncharacterized protein n=1 Tax=Rhizophagus irregularis TaxID=588596 RepID=A0A2N0NIZ0_9GLOM|nr:hypothetical protein RhiirA5_438531 [Rhizophagus irregularis]